MKINSENLWKYINELATGEKVKFNVYYDDNYFAQIYWNGESFEWGQGTFTSEAFFNPLYDFVVVEEEKKIPEKITPESMIKSNQSINDDIIDKINEIITYLESKGE